MTREEAIDILDDNFTVINTHGHYKDKEVEQTRQMAIEALERKPYEKFESTKDHIYKLAGDYKCWDNRLTQDEALELCHILEQEPCTLDDAREDFVFDVYNILDFLPTNDETNRIIEVFDRVTSDIRQEPILDKIRAEIEQKIEQERFARSVFRGEEKDVVKAHQCTGSIFAYNNVIKIIDKYKVESEG